MGPGRPHIAGLTAVLLLAFGYSAADSSAAFHLRSPKARAVVSKPPLLDWGAAPGASRYNIQVWRDNRKILSRWPRGTEFQLRSRWRYKGRRYRLVPAQYYWYVWPAYSWGYGSFKNRSFVFGRLPSNKEPPRVSGHPREGESLSATPGTWSGTAPLTFSYVWQRCAPNATCSTIAGATSKTLTLGAADIDYAVRVVVTARNLAGTRRASSVRTAVVLAAPPKNVKSPRLTGGFQQGRVIGATVGSWQSSRPVTFSFRWQRCNRSGSGCSRIAGATAGRLLRKADFLRRVRVLVRAANSGGVGEVSVLSPVVGRVMTGSAQRDVLSGSIGADLIRAGKGDDRVSAGPGNDHVVGGDGSDFLALGSGNDVVHARDGEADSVVCGSGKDVAVVDRRDHVHGCETVRRG